MAGRRPVIGERTAGKIFPTRGTRGHSQHRRNKFTPVARASLKKMEPEN
jgi:hypothetical protein